MRTPYNGILKAQQDAIRDVSRILNKKITFQKLTEVKTPNNFSEEVWVDWNTLWAEKKNLRGREFYAAKTINEEKTVKFTVRYHKELEELNSTQYRIVHAGKEYNIVFVDNLQNKNQWIEIKALEVT